MSVSETGSRSQDRGLSVLNFSPVFSERFEMLFYESAYDVAFLSLPLQTTHLNRAIASVKVRQREARARARQDDYAELAPVAAALLLLRDLLQIGWRMTIVGTKIQLSKQGVASDLDGTKQQIRESMQLERRESLQSKAVKDFIRSMERIRIVDDRPKNIFSLVADGQKLHTVMQQALEIDQEKRASFLSRKVKPYLQLVEGDRRDEFTNFRLFDIWRYFRLTWSTPYRSIPGRNIFYLVRDAGQPNHPIMGIAALANCVIGLKCRDDRIGWTPDAIAERLREASKINDLAYKKLAWETVELLKSYLDQGINAISLDGISTRNAVEHPTLESIQELLQIAALAAEERNEHLRQEAILEGEYDLELTEPEMPARVTVDLYDRDSSKSLFRRKRAAKLARLLEAKLLLQHLDVFNNAPTALPYLLWADSDWKIPFDKGRSALRTLLNANKESKVGTSMMEIVVCGGVQPYSYLLGGKLVSMLLASSQVVSDYSERYGEMTSTIASQIAGRDITRPARLVYLGTTSLYVGDADKSKYLGTQNNKIKPHSSSQYNRIQVPAEIVKGFGEVRYDCIGLTEGFGVIHFSSETREALEELDILLHNAKRVNSIFGEGTSPRLRKIRQGITLLGLDDRFLVHGQARLVYGINLAHNTERYLTGQDPEPNYIFRQRKSIDTSKKIANYWIKRWLTSRINHTPSLEKVANFVPRDGAISSELKAEDAQIRLDLDGPDH